MERLQKIIAASGIASRRQAETMITEGRVRVNNHIVTTLGTQADPEKDQIEVNGRILPKTTHITYALNKPKGVVCSKVHQAKEQLIIDLVPSFPPVYPVGRLDKESEGLILLTNDGDLAQSLTHPSNNHLKEYRLQVKWQKEAPQKPLVWVEQQLLKGVKLGDGLAKADTVEAKQFSPERIALRITVHEGRNHLLRRMCATLGLDVTSLCRTKFATLSLDRLKSGQFRQLTPQELTLLRAS